MASILNGLEFIADASCLIGYSSQKLVYDCDVLAAIYGQWVSENLEQLTDRPEDAKTATTKRSDIRFMQLLDNMNRVLSTLYTLSDLEMLHKDIMHLSSTVAAVENLTSVLVELTVRAVGIIEIDRENSATKVAANIMLNPQTRFIYMGESLLTFANTIVELAGREYVDGKRIKVYIVLCWRLVGNSILHRRCILILRI